MPVNGILEPLKVVQPISVKPAAFAAALQSTLYSSGLFTDPVKFKLTDEVPVQMAEKLLNVIAGAGVTVAIAATRDVEVQPVAVMRV